MNNEKISIIANNVIRSFKSQHRRIDIENLAFSSCNNKQELANAVITYLIENEFYTQDEIPDEKKEFVISKIKDLSNKTPDYVTISKQCRIPLLNVIIIIREYKQKNHDSNKREKRGKKPTKRLEKYQSESETVEKMIHDIIYEGFAISEIPFKYPDFKHPELSIRPYLKDNYEERLNDFNSIINNRKRCSIDSLDPMIKEVIISQIGNIIEGRISVGKVTEIINNTVLVKGNPIDPYIVKNFIRTYLKKNDQIGLGGFENIYFCRPKPVQQSADVLSQCAADFEEYVNDYVSQLK